jgi:hypothetical protein
MLNEFDQAEFERIEREIDVIGAVIATLIIAMFGVALMVVWL